ncbi:MAG: hotdog fold thioesterase, partial [Flavobacteriales bacterium]
MSLEELNTYCKDSLIDHLGIEFQFLTEGEIKATMPVDKTTWQPHGYLHGGATLALAETVASVGSVFLIDTKNYDVK